MLNVVNLIGRVTKNPETRSVGDSLVANFTLALNEYWKDKNGEKQESVSFIDCEAWGKAAGVASEYIQKGSLILVEGKLKMDSWEKDGKKFSRLKVRANRIGLMGSKPKDEYSQEATTVEEPSAKPESQVDEPDLPY